MATRTDAVQVDVRLDRASPVPLYHQLAQAIEIAIESGALKPGDRLENELSLTRRLGLARPTARQAIQELVRKGLLVRRRGLGTQVVRPAIHRDVRLSSLYDDLTASGRAPETTVLAHESCTPATAGIPVLSELLPADEPLQRLKRLRRADGEPLAIMTNFLPARFELGDGELAGRGLYTLLREQGAQIAIAHQIIGARLADADEAALLQQPAPLACVTAELVVYDDAGVLVELGRHLYRSDRYTVQTSLVV
ncbi:MULTISPECIES: GntR family transcriptional regulator [Pseudonocardia]|uniref:HTH-type transcriptional repressor YvoA n=2 Tax=Pseudonocardia TaxID=1847 RepID=A0A1Y2MT48_PSEAH|nr:MULTISPECIES: GntR family transcriptional regulator [Pseudonocardia]OSY38382.1 HTH-type transcriptional repressor YvoA [Pseudonocardia autotrophica]TDN72574.1 DNA-binding GntR family transcriptional regulator [Pseudonocardia autotrophica]BBG03282.1 GntR family transcriptional regulator [Pseudonocardia autotrophica]GEC24540.1 GntR family transcriptional regulator [Pseudonocardia saturnea]